MAGIKVPVELIVSGADKLKKALGPLTDKAAAAKLAREQVAADRRVSAARLANLQKLSKAELALKLKNQLDVQRAAQQKARQELSSIQRAAAAKLAVEQNAARASLRGKQAAARSELSHDNAVARIQLAQRLRNDRQFDASARAAIKAEQRLQQARARADLSQDQAAARNRLSRLQATAVAERTAIARSASEQLAVRQRAAGAALRASQAQIRAQLQGERTGAAAGTSYAAQFGRAATRGLARQANEIVRATSSILPSRMRGVGVATGRSIVLGVAGVLTAGSLAGVAGAAIAGVGAVLVAGGVAAGAATGAIIRRTLTGGLKRLVVIDDAKTLFKGLGASAKTTAKFMAIATDVVTGTRFSLAEAAKTTSTLFATGVKGGAEMKRTLELVSSAATISGRSFGDMGAIFGKVAADGRIQGLEFRQFTEAGIPIVKALSKELGVTQTEVRKLGREGKIGWDSFLNAAQDALKKAGSVGKGAVSGLARNLGIQLDKIGAAFLKQGFKQAPRILKDVTTGLASLIKPAGKIGKQFFGKDFLPSKSIKEFFASIRAGIPGFGKFLDNAKKFVVEFVTKTDWKALGKSLKKFGTAVVGIDLGVTADNAKKLADALNGIADALGKIGSVIDVLKKIDTATNPSNLGKGEKNPFSTGPLSGSSRTGKTTQGIAPPTLDVKKIQETFRANGVAIGTALAAGTVEGVTTATPGAVPTISQQFQSFIDGVKNLFGIHSPSTVFIAIGGDVIRGFIQGVLAAGATLLGLAGQVFGPFINGARTLLANAGTSIASGFNTAKTAVVATVGGIVAGARTRLGALPGALQGVASRAGSAISGGLKAATGAVGGAVSRIVSGARSRAAGLVTGLGSAASRAASAVGSRLRAGVSAAGAAASRIVSTARSRLAPMASQMGSAASKAAQAVGSKISAGAGRAASAARSLAARAKAGLSGLRGGFTTAGAQAGAGLAAGIRSRISSVASSAASIVRRAIAAAKAAQKSASPSKVYMGIGKDAGDGYAIGMASTTKVVAATAAKVVANGAKVATRSLVAQAKTLRTQLARAQAQVEALAEARSGFTSTFTGTIDRLTTFTDKKTPTSIVTFLGKSLDKAREFTTVMKQLREKGLGDAAFQQLAEAGADAGLAAANAISSGGPAVIKQVNNLLLGITKESNSFGVTAAKSLFDAGQQAANGMVKGLTTRQNALIAAAKRISKKMVAAVRAALGINSPSRVMAERVGKHIFPGAVQGAEATLPQVTKDFRKMALSIIPPSPATTARNTAPQVTGQPVTARPVTVKVDQHFYGPTTGAERVRDLDWTLRYGTAPALDELTGAPA